MRATPRMVIVIPSFSLFVTCSPRSFVPASVIRRGFAMVIIVMSTTVVFSSPRKRNPNATVEVRNPQKKSVRRTFGFLGKCRLVRNRITIETVVESMNLYARNV